MKLWLVLLSACLVMTWLFVNGLLMLRRPDKFNGFVWWPRFRSSGVNVEATVLSRGRIRVLGIAFAAASSLLLLGVILPAIVGLIIQDFKR